jgi:hypothetical protein
MTRAGDEDPDYAERVAQHAQVHKNAWQRTLDDMEALAEELREDGWDVVTIPAGHTAPENPDAGETDRWGLVHVIPGNKAEPFGEAVEANEFPRFEVYQQEVDGRVFLVTALEDPDSETAILIAGNFEMRHAPGLVNTAQDEGHMYTHVQKLDKTVLGTFRHEDYEPFFPDPDTYEDYVVEANVGVEEEPESGDEE